MEKGVDLVTRAATVLERSIRNPQLLCEVWWKLRSRITDRRHRQFVHTYATRTSSSIDEALARVLDVQPSFVKAAMEADTLKQLLTDLTEYSAQYATVRMGGAAFLEAIYAVVRLTRPQVLMETGVAHGYSSAVILQAIRDNGIGKLYSIDLPTFSRGAVAHTGGAIPAYLRSVSQWELALGPDRQRLPPLLSHIGPIDFFHYDSDKSYAGMRFTLSLAWSHLRPGAVLMMDDIHSNDAFIEFVDGLGLKAWILAKPAEQGVYQGAKTYYVGVVRKPFESDQPGDRTTVKARALEQPGAERD